MRFLSDVLKKCVDFVKADVKFEDETNQFCVMLRVCQIILVIYFFLFEILTLIFWPEGNLLLVVPWIILLVLGFFTTYRFRTRVVFHIFSGMSIVWMWLFVRYFGWDVGAQHFLFPLLVVSFFATFDNRRGKVIYTLVLLAFRLYLFLVVSNLPPIYALPERTQISFQILNMFTLFSIMFYVCWTFSNTNQEAQRKLTYYNKRLQQEARTDPLTGLLNRRSMLEYLEKSISENTAGFLTIAIGDIDFFKKINDTRGHNCGDIVLCQMGKLFMDYMQDKGMVCRWGGEEFCFAFPDNGDVGRTCADELRLMVQDMKIKDPAAGDEFSVTMTFGVEEYDFSSTVTELIKRADDKLYYGKDHGKNCTVY